MGVMIYKSRLQWAESIVVVLMEGLAKFANPAELAAA
jgi:hypothetical protein